MAPFWQATQFFSGNDLALKTRDRQPELMDDPGIDKDVHEKALVGLTRLNTFSGVRGALYRRVRTLAMARPDKPLRLIDFAAGSGDLPIAWAKRAKRDSIDLQITTVDISATAVETQLSRAKEAGVTINAIQADCLHDDLPSGFDLATCSLFMHHLEKQEVFRLLQVMQAASPSAMMVCDLDRSRFNLVTVGVAARILTRSPIVHYDSVASVRAAFTRNEFKQIAEQSLGRPVDVKRLFPSRFVMTLDDVVATQKSKDPSVAFA